MNDPSPRATIDAGRHARCARLIAVFVAASCAACATTRIHGGPYLTGDNRWQGQCLQQRIAAYGADLTTLLSLGRIYLLEGYPAEAADQFRAALRLDATSVDARLMLSTALGRLPARTSRERIDLLEEALRISPDRVDVRLSLAHVHAAERRYDAAQTHFDEVIRSSHNPDLLVSAHLGWAGVLEIMGDSAGAAAQLAQARTIVPDLDDWIRRARLADTGAAPAYAGHEFAPVGGTHPALEVRIERLMVQTQDSSAIKPCP